MGIDKEGIIDRGWARSLDRFSGGDQVVRFWLNQSGRFGSRGISRSEARFIREVFRTVDQLTGFRVVETVRRNQSDIELISVDNLGGSMIGLTTRRRGWFEVAWEDRAGNRLTLGERRTITHEIGHSFGLNHPYGNGFNPRYNTSDTIMSYNNTRNFQFTSSDVAALQSLWGV